MKYLSVPQLPDGEKPEPINLTLEQAVSAGGVSRTSLYRANRRGDLVFLKFGTKTLINYQHYKRFLANLPRFVGRTGPSDREV